MHKVTKSCLIITTALTLITGGCSWSNSDTAPKPGAETRPAPKASQEDDHITITKNHIVISVTKKPKYFPKTMIEPEEGKVVVGLFAAFTNNSQTDLHIDPNFVVITTSDGQKQHFSETKTGITGKGAFKTLDIPPTYRGGGLVLFEIKDNLKIDSVSYNDQKGNVFDVTIMEGDRKI